MAQIKGQTGNPYGRRKGSQNKVTKASKEVITVFIEDNFQEFERCWHSLKNADKVRVYISMLRFVIPTMASVKIENNQDKNFIDELLTKQKSMK
jgi:hypothetical protein